MKSEHATLADACDCCDALLSDDERQAGERFGCLLCDRCAGEYASANKQECMA